MPSHQFTLIVEGPDLRSDTVVAALFDAGRDDALIGRTTGSSTLISTGMDQTRRPLSCRLSQMSNACPM